MKRTACLILAFIMTISCAFTAFAGNTAGTTLGDFDGNNSVTSDDAVYLLRYTLFPEYYPLTGFADFDHNGNVTSDDAVYLLRYTLFPDYYPLEGDLNGGGSYTFNESINGYPNNWNPHTWTTSADNYFAGYCEMGFVEADIADDGVNFKWTYEMATNVEDITKDFADKEKWDIPSDAESEYVYKITLNPDAKWEDGTPINADSYIESMKRLLDPKMQNFRCNTYTSGYGAIKNAYEYLYSDITDFDDVGLLKTGRYELTYICRDYCDEFNFLVNLTSNWLVKTDLYDAGMATDIDTGLDVTDYGTSADTYASYGPYKLVSIDGDKAVLEKNDQWYGWTDGKHEGQYQTTAIVCSFLSDPDMEFEMFMKGQLDITELRDEHIAAYQNSDRLLKSDESYTFRYIFATDVNALEALEGGDASVNKRILAYKDFRKALSLAIDRAEYIKEAAPGYKVGLGLLNRTYYYDIENDPESIYRNSEEAKDAILRLYGVEYGEGKIYADVNEAYDAVTGYDVEEAKKLFTAAYESAKADGNYTDGQKIVINCECGSYLAYDIDVAEQGRILNRYCAAATAGTPLEGKIEFVFKCESAMRYDDVANGRIEMIRGAWGGAPFYPFSSIRVYTEPDYMGGLARIHESCGWDPTREKCTITADFYGEGEITMEHTLQDWAKLLNGYMETSGGNDFEREFTNTKAKLKVLAELEYQVLNSYQCIPFAAETIVSMYSQKINYGTQNYNIMYGFGGIRYITYNYDDAEWEAYVASQGGTLSYN